MRKIKLIIAIAIIISLILPSASYAGKSGALQNDDVKKIITDTANFLLMHQLPRGDFNYEYWPYLDEFTKDDNIVRQIAAPISMQIAYKTGGDEKYLKALKKTADYWMSKSKTEKKDGVMVRYFEEDGKALLGSVAVYYIGVSVMHDASPQWWTVNRSKLAEMINFINWMKKQKNGFAEYYTPGMEKKDIENVPGVGYFDGESLLALARYDAIENTTASKELVYAAYRDIIESYRLKTDVPLYLWFMTASRELYGRYKDPLFYEYADKFQTRLLQQNTLPEKTMSNNCWIMEGMNAYLNLQKAVTGKVDANSKAIADSEMRRLQYLQIKADSRVRVFLNGQVGWYAPKSKGVGGFLTSFSAPRQRIDNQQHCMAAYKSWLDLISP